ncbi:MAG: hypothetical protein AB1782_06950 [Cyanobacteriota bacterium]
MNKHSGNSLAQYAIIIALVALALVPIFFVFGKTIYDNFVHFYNVFTNKEITSVSTTIPNNNNLIPGSLGGTPKKPVSQCDGNICNIDFGEFVLSSVPQDFGEYVETNGNSGGTDSLLAIIEQIADQLEAKGDTAGAEDYRDLANLGHFIADGMETNENLASQCSDLVCYKNAIENSFMATPLPDNISKFLPDYNSNQVTSVKNIISNFGDIGYAAFLSNTPDRIDEYNSKLTQNPAFAAYKIYDDIQTNPNYSDNLKSITKTLMNQITYLAYQADDLTDNVFDNNTNSGPSYMDIDGNSFSIDNSINSVTDIKDITNPQIALGTNFKSALICSTGNFDDNGQACK